MLDEVLYTHRTWPNLDWSLKNNNTTLDKAENDQEALAAIIMISREFGLE